MPAKISAASAICGTHFGLTNAETSMTECPASLRSLTNAILSAVAIAAASFWRPSRGPTSTIVTRVGRLLKIDQAGIRLDEIPGTAVNRLDCSIAGRAHRQFHFHGFQDD